MTPPIHVFNSTSVHFTRWQDSFSGRVLIENWKQGESKLWSSYNYGSRFIAIDKADVGLYRILVKSRMISHTCLVMGNRDTRQQRCTRSSAPTLKQETCFKQSSSADGRGNDSPSLIRQARLLKTGFEYEIELSVYRTIPLLLAS